jgi:hypothetical protein
MIRDLGFGVGDLGVKVEERRFGVSRFQGLRLRVKGLGFRV